MTSLSSRKTTRAPLLAVFASAARVAVIRVFMLDPRREYYQRQIEAATGLPIRAIQRELERFTGAGLLYRRAEGNRMYYRVDTDFRLFPELRGIIMKTAGPEDHLRGTLALDDSVRLAFLNEAEDRVLIVTAPGKRFGRAEPGPYAIDVMSTEEFTRALSDEPASLEAFLRGGVDLLGRRDDVIWRHIEAAGYEVHKGKGVP